MFSSSFQGGACVEVSSESLMRRTNDSASRALTVLQLFAAGGSKPASEWMIRGAKKDFDKSCKGYGRKPGSSVKFSASVLRMPELSRVMHATNVHTTAIPLFHAVAVLRRRVYRYVYAVEGNATVRMQLPKDEKKMLGLVQPFLVRAP
jgi:hypothetical protein